jgi:uncharacterized membrane protein
MDAGWAKLVEVVLLFGALLAFGVWQLRSVDRDRRARLAREAAQARTGSEAEVARATPAGSVAGTGNEGARAAAFRDSD